MLTRKEVESWPPLEPVPLDPQRVLALFQQIDDLQLEKEKLLAELDKQTKRVNELHDVAQEKCAAADPATQCGGCILLRYDKQKQITNELLAAIKEHRDQKGDDRCWLDDNKLYAAAGLESANTALPPKEQFLSNCARYHTSRVNPDDKYETVVEIEARISAALLTKLNEHFSRPDAPRCGTWAAAEIKKVLTPT